MSEWPLQNSEMARLIRAFDWTSTPLGRIDYWPQSLKTVVDLMLASPSMMSLVWGADAIHIYNDSFTELLREHRAGSLGRSAYETFARSRDIFAADVAAGMAGQSKRLLTQRYPVLRNGQLADAWFDVDYAPIRDDTGAVAGVLWTLKDVTAQVEGERALRASQHALAADLEKVELLRSLSERLVPEDSLQSTYDEILSATVAITGADAGTMQIYDPPKRALLLIASQGFSRIITDYFHSVDASSSTACGIALKSGTSAFVDFPEKVSDFGCQLLVGEGIQSAVAYPLMSRSGAPLGMLNAHWRHARHRLDEGDMRFLGLLSRQAADLIEQRRSQTALRDNEQWLQTLMHGVPQLVWRAVNGGHWTWASPQWTDFTGQAEADSHGSGWLDPVHPDDRDGVRAIWSGAIDRGEYHADYRIWHQSEGRYRWFQTRATPVRDRGGEVVEWLGTSTDVDDLRQLQQRQQVLVAELQHRTRNLIGVVRSTADRTGDTSVDFADFRRRFHARLEALARVQGLLSRLQEDDRIAFDELLQTEITAMHGSGERVTLCGPSGIRLRSSMVQTLAMAIHELATNAIKYGALGQPRGHLSISWRLVEPDGHGRPRLHIDWRESGVEMPPAQGGPRGGGHGRELIEHALPYQLSAETSFELGQDGAHCTITIPVSASNAPEATTGSLALAK